MLKILFIFLFALVGCDFPVHCEWPSMKGKWKFQMTNNKNDKDVVWKCSMFKKPPMELIKEMNIEIIEPNQAIDLDTGANGTFTLIYDQAIEITIEGKVLMAYFDFKETETGVISYCNRTLTGFFHDLKQKEGEKEFAKNWGCMIGALVGKGSNSLHHYSKKKRTLKIPTEQDIEEINQKQSTWKAIKYSDRFYIDFHERTKNSKPAFNTFTNSMKKKKVSNFPFELDWRNIDGKNFISNVRNQLSCGSCYLFSSNAMFEARARIESNNEWQPVFSVQEQMDCSVYGQGCDGGFPYASSKWAMDLGIIEEEFDPYIGKTKECKHIKPEAKGRSFVKDVKYIGGYYGACNEDAMIEELQNGPISVSFKVYPDFRNYKEGIYYHRDTDDINDPHFEEVTHAVLIVGYGKEISMSSGVKYWIVKNSWGETWGEKGYFRIIRGINNCGIESIAVSANIVV